MQICFRRGGGLLRLNHLVKVQRWRLLVLSARLHEHFSFLLWQNGGRRRGGGKKKLLLLLLWDLWLVKHGCLLQLGLLHNKLRGLRGHETLLLH